MKRATAALALISVFTATTSTGCLGTFGLGDKVKRFNLEATENRYGREGIFLVLNVIWVYRICAVLDLFVFNSIEFWSGENPLNGKRPLVDIPKSEAEKIGFRDLERAQVEYVSENAVKLHLGFENGDRMTVDVLHDDDEYKVSYLGRVLFEGQVDSAAVLEGVQ